MTALPPDERAAAKRQLRANIARRRRRIDARLVAGRREGRRLMSWRTYVRRYPAGTLLVAFAVGLCASAGLRRRAWSRTAGAWLLRQTMSGLPNVLWRELAAILAGERRSPTQADPS